MMTMKNKVFLILALNLMTAVVTLSAFGMQGHPSSRLKEISKEWIQLQSVMAQQRLFANISPEGTLKGTVVASPSRQDPDYFFHWTRDAALVMDTVRRLGQGPKTTPQFVEKTNSALFDFVILSRLHQMTEAPGDLGEPKYHVDGRPYTGPWGRPQNDGPALRAITLSYWALELLEQNQGSFVAQWLYSKNSPSSAVVSRDLQYVEATWKDPSFDLWEETYGDQFYTLATQRKALWLGAILAERMGDLSRSQELLSQAEEVSAKMETFFWSEKGIVFPLLNQKGGLTGKNSHLDIAIALSALHAEIPGASFGVEDLRILESTLSLAEAFSSLYPLNKTYSQYAPAIGRYPEDVYGGSHFNHGNPWFLTTFATAELHYRIARSQTLNFDSPRWRRVIQRSARLARVSRSTNEPAKITLKKIGDAYLLRALSHTDQQGSMAEQFDKHNGYMTSARDLTWSYSAFLTALMARD